MRGDIQAATVASVTANVNAPKGKTYKLRDFLPTYGQVVERQTVDAMKERLQQITLAMGGVVLGNDLQSGS